MVYIVYHIHYWLTFFYIYIFKKLFIKIFFCACAVHFLKKKLKTFLQYIRMNVLTKRDYIKNIDKVLKQEIYRNIQKRKQDKINNELKN